MIIVLIASGLLGGFYYYVMLDGLMKGKLDPSWGLWSRCVATSAFLLSISATLVAHYFGAKANLWLTLSLWPLTALTLHGGYWVVFASLPEKTQREFQHED